MMVASEVRRVKVESFVLLFQFQQCGHVNFEYDCLWVGEVLSLYSKKKKVGIVVN